MTTKARQKEAARLATEVERAEYLSQQALFNVVDLDDKRRESRRMVTAGAFSFKYLPDRQPGTKARYIFLAERGADVPKPKRLSDLRTRKDFSSGPLKRDPVALMVKHYQTLAERTEGPVIVSLFDDFKVSPKVAKINCEVRGCLRAKSSALADRFEFHYVDPADWGSL